MAAGSEGYVDTRGNSTFLEDSIGTMISKVLAAKVLADKERKFAQKKALEQGIDEAQFNSMFPRGDFFKKALIGEFGGFKIKKKKQELAALYRKALLVGKVTKNKKLRGKVVGQLKQSLIYSKANLKNAKSFRSQFDYTDYEDYLSPQSEKIPSTRKKTKNAIDGSNKRVSREQIIESIDAIAKSIERTAQAITQSSSSVYGTLITANQLQADVAQDLKVRNTTLEDKLQNLVDVISKQTRVQKDIIDKREDIQQEAQLERKTVAAGAETPDDLRTQKNESRTYSSFANETEMMDAYLQQPPEVKPVSGMANDLPSMEANGFPKAEKGGSFSGKGGLELHGTEALIPSTGSAKIVSGPDSGYLHKIDKPTTVVPLDNNYTQGEPSAIDGKVRPKPETPIVSSPESKLSSNSSSEINSSITNNIKPQTSVVSLPNITKSNVNVSKTQQFELGTQNNFNDTTFSNAININTDATQPLIDAANLLPMAAGGGTLAMTSEYLNSIGDSGGGIKPLIDQNARALANVFGLPSTIVNRSTGSKTISTLDQEKDDEEKKDDSKNKSLFEKMKEGFGKFMELLAKKIEESGGGGGGGGGGGADDGMGGGGAGAGGSGQDFATLATVAALESGSAQGRADVAQSVFNRLADKTYGSSITDILTRQGQYQVAFKDPTASSGSGTQVAEVFKNIKTEDDAVKAIMYYYKARGQSITAERARKIYRESASAISDPKLRKNAAAFVGGRTEFLGRGLGGSGSISRGGGSDNDFFAAYGSGNQMKRGAAAAPGGLFNAPSTTPTAPIAGAKPGATALQRADTSKSLSPEQWRAQQQAIKEADSKGLTGVARAEYIAQKVEAVVSPIFQRPQQQQPSSIFDMSSAPKQNQPTIVALNTPAASKAPTAGSSQPTNAQTATVDRGANPLKGSGLYIDIG